MTLVDTNVLLDVLLADPVWADLSIGQLRFLSQTHELLINPIVYAELVPAFSSVDALDGAIADMELIYAELPRAALFLAGKAFLQYRKQGANKQNVLPDFFIGAHAIALNISVLTRDALRYSTYFPTLRLISP